MNGRFLLSILVSAAACSTAPHAERVPQVPPLAIEQPADLQRDTGSRTDADHSAPSAAELPEPAGETRSTAVIHRSVVHLVETPPVETQSSVASEPAAGGETDSQPRSYAAPRPSVTFSGSFYGNPGYGFFPVHTVIGASIGAAIGSHHGNAHRGAMIGGTAGFFLDMGRAWH